MARPRALRNRSAASIEIDMKTPLIVAVAFAAIISPLSAHGAGTVEVLQPWSRPAVAGTNAVGYMVLANRGHAADALEKVESPIAAQVEMHASAMTDGVMSMKRQGEVAVPAGGQVIFGPGAYHLMFIGLTRTLNAGDLAPATLTFASGAKVKVRFAVIAGMGPPGTAR